MTVNGRSAAPTNHQKSLLIDFMKDHPHLVKGTFTNTFSHKSAQTLWGEISEKLNAMPGGANKDWKKWRKTWQDLKKLTKSKLVEKRKWQNKTGGGPPVEIIIDENMVDLIDNKEVEGHINVAEPEIIFQFEENSEQERPQTPIVSAPPNPTPNVLLVPPKITNAKMASPAPPVINLPMDPMLEDLIIDIENDNQEEKNSNDNGNLERNIKHNYAINYPEVTPRKKITQTQRLQTSLKLSQQLVKGVNFRNNILDNYYTEKIAFLKHKTQNDLKLIEAVEKLSKSIDENTQQTKALLQIVSTNNVELLSCH